jgi:1,4-dihydroxy-2-naphthoate octaprenyltransferase
MNIQAWLLAFRLRTLPLALASILMGSFLANSHKAFQWSIFGLCVLTTVLLQILSNLANDYGDSKHGADSKDRQGPKRAVQAGLISSQAMKNAMILFAISAFVSGLGLLWVALGTNLRLFVGFLLLGVAALVAAVTYTAGSKPYGYAGLGDISVLLFFGWVGVMGSYFLYTKTFLWDLLLPATCCGCFATAVLNVNNIRDIDSDRQAGKLSIPVRIGREKAVVYHAILLFLGFACAVCYTLLNFMNGLQFLFLLAAPLLAKNFWAVQTQKTAQSLDPYLKQMAISALLFVLSFGLGLYLSAML